MQRRRQILPDENGVVTLEALIQALIEAASWLDFAGGCLTVVTGRAPTGLPGEMVTTGAILEWRDRTDARPQPEPASTVTAQPLSRDEQREIADEVLAEPEPEVAALAEAHSEENPDGFDYSTLQEEDVDQPELAR